MDNYPVELEAEYVDELGDIHTIQDLAEQYHQACGTPNEEPTTEGFIDFVEHRMDDGVLEYIRED